MNLISFESDYTTGAHPKILENLTKTNFEALSGYGSDKYSSSAKQKIKAACENDDIKVSFLVGGTQTNSIVISALLRDWQGVIAADTGHIAVHEAGAIEYTGHKVLTLKEHQGKIDANELEDWLKSFYNDENHDHAVEAGMVYISHPTEYGTLYKKAELEKISEICREYGLYLYMDGARLGYALESHGSDLSLADISRLCDVFYIGGTKVGALCGEAVVFKKTALPKQFLTLTKQHGALLAKGRLLGIQFDTLFSDNLYFKISRNAIDKAEKLKELLREKGYEFYLETPTNQQFVVLDKKSYEALQKKVKIGFWENLSDGRVVVRFATSWSTADSDIEYLKEIL